jgi:mono/diheme cytochrome c family protein
MRSERVGPGAGMTRVWRVVPLLVVLFAFGPAQAQAPAPDAALVLKGEGLFKEQGCYGCHTVGKFGTQGIAPDLSHVGAKHDVGYLTRWLKDPESQRPTAHMPKIGLGDDEAKALAAYLGSLR